MPCTPPTNRSPGHLFLKYEHTGVAQHTVSWRFITGVDITNVGILHVEAERIAAKLQAALDNNFTIYGWGIKNADGSLFYDSSLTASLTGTHSVGVNGVNYASNTVTFTGHGNSNVPGECNGPEHCVLFVGDTYTIDPEEKRLNVATDSGLLGYWTALGASLYVPADFYGQQVDFNASATTQFNARTQRKLGA